jgi:very-short-patch-repair endonuclease
MPTGVYKHKPNQGYQKGHPNYNLEGKGLFKKGHSPIMYVDTNLKRSNSIKSFYIKHPEVIEEMQKKIKSTLKNNPEIAKKRNENIKKNAISNSNYGMKNKHQSEETKRILSKNHIGIKLSQEHVTKIIQGIQDSSKTKTLEYKKMRSTNALLLWQKTEYRDKIIKSILKGLLKRPTSYEKKISELCIENNLPFIYTGDGTFLIGYKNPDFVNKKEKIAIEVYYSYFKIRDFGSCENYEKQRKEYFDKYGWKVIFIRKEDIVDNNWKEICLNKIKGDF